MRYICERCGAYYDSWDGHCDCEDEEIKNDIKIHRKGDQPNERSYNIQAADSRNS